MKTITYYVMILLLMLMVLVAIAITSEIMPPSPIPPPPAVIPPLPTAPPIPPPPGAYVITATPTTVKSGILTNVTFTVFYYNQPIRDVQVFYSGITQTISCGSNYANCSTGTTDANGTVILSVKAAGLCPAEIDCDKIRVSATTYGYTAETELTVIHPPIEKIEQILIDIATFIIIFFVIILSPPLNQFFAIILIPFFLAKRYLPRIDVKYGNFFNDNFIAALIPYIIFGSLLRLLEDTGIISHSLEPPIQYLFITPVVYVVTLSVAILSLLLTKSIASKLNLQNWRVLFGGMGIVLSMSVFALLLSGMSRVNLEWVHPEVFLWSLGIGTGLIILFYGISRFFGFSLMTNKLNAIILWAHILNVLSIYTWMESVWHIPLDNLIPVFIKVCGYDWMYLTLPILWILNARNMKSDNFRNLLKFIILYIGLAPAIRNILRMVLGV